MENRKQDSDLVLSIKILSMALIITLFLGLVFLEATTYVTSSESLILHIKPMATKNDILIGKTPEQIRRIKLWHGDSTEDKIVEGW